MGELSSSSCRPRLTRSSASLDNDDLYSPRETAEVVTISRRETMVNVFNMVDLRVVTGPILIFRGATRIQRTGLSERIELGPPRLRTFKELLILKFCRSIVEFAFSFRD